MGDIRRPDLCGLTSCPAIYTGPQFARDGPCHLPTPVYVADRHENCARMRPICPLPWGKTFRHPIKPFGFFGDFVDFFLVHTRHNCSTILVSWVLVLRGYELPFCTPGANQVLGRHLYPISTVPKSHLVSGLRGRYVQAQSFAALHFARQSSGMDPSRANCGPV